MPEPNNNSKEALQILQTLEPEKLELLTKFSLLFTTEELSKMLIKISKPGMKKMLLSYL